jgi:hypothetical protein
VSERFLEAYRAAKTPTARHLAQALGLSRQRIHQLGKKHSVTFVRDLSWVEGAVEKAKETRKKRGFVKAEWGSKDPAGKRIPSLFVGGMSELLVCADLLRRGAYVYRAVTAVSSADLIADVEGVLKRIEVKTARKNKFGRLSVAIRKDKQGRYDVLALVDENAVIKYVPDPFVKTDDVTN